MSGFSAAGLAGVQRGLPGRRLLVALGLAVIVQVPFARADLNEGQRKLLAEAQKHLQQAESTLKLAQDSAGPGDGKPAGSRAKLAMTRLNSTKQLVAQVTARLEHLPHEDAEVRAVQDRHDKLAAAVKALEARLTGESTPAEKPPAEGVRLDYRQEQLLKDARFALRELQGQAAALTALVAELKTVADERTIDHRLVQRGVNTIAVADRRTKEARDKLAGLPADGRGVPAAQAELAEAVAAVEAARQFLPPLHERLAALTDPANHATLVADTQRLRELGSMYADTQVFHQDRARAATLIREAAAAAAEHERLAKVYATLIQQRTPEGQQLESAGKFFNEKFAAFAAAAKEQQGTLPAQIEADLADARKLAAEAVAERKPAFFTGGIPQRLGWAEEKLALYAALDPEGGAKLEEKLAQTRQELKQAQAALKEQIIAANELPPDRYTGGDRAELARLATEAWKKVAPDADVLAIRIPSAAWEREVLWRNQTGSTWYKIDRSRLQVQLVVRQDDKLAVVRPIDLWKDHLSEDRIKAFPFHEAGAELQPQDYLLLEKVK